MYQNQVQNKPTAAYVLSLLGGIFGLLISIAFLALGALAYSAVNTYSDYYTYDTGAFGWGWEQMGRINPDILHHRSWRTLRINRRNTCTSLQTHNGWSTTTVRSSTTAVRTTTSSLRSASTTANHTNLPTMRTRRTRKPAFLPQLRQTT